MLSIMDLDLRREVYVALIRAALWPNKRDGLGSLGTQLAQRLRLADSIRGAFGVSSSQHELVLQYALAHNAYFFLDLSTRYAAVSAARSAIAPSAVIVSASEKFNENMLSPSDFDTLDGYSAWMEQELLGLEGLTSGGRPLQRFEGHLEVEVVGGEVHAPKIRSGGGGGGGCFSCFSGGGPVDVMNSTLYTMVHLRGNDVEGPSSGQQQKTPLVPQTVNPIWRFKLKPYQVLRPDAALQVSVRQVMGDASMDMGARMSTFMGSSSDQHVGTIHVPLGSLVKMAHGAVAAQTLQVPVYSHFSKLGKGDPKSSEEQITDGEDETHGRCVYDPGTKSLMGTHSRQARGNITLRITYITQEQDVSSLAAASRSDVLDLPGMPFFQFADEAGAVTANTGGPPAGSGALGPTTYLTQGLVTAVMSLWREGKLDGAAAGATAGGSGTSGVGAVEPADSSFTSKLTKRNVTALTAAGGNGQNGTVVDGGAIDAGSIRLQYTIQPHLLSPNGGAPGAAFAAPRRRLWIAGADGGMAGGGGGLGMGAVPSGMKGRSSQTKMVTGRTSKSKLAASLERDPPVSASTVISSTIPKASLGGNARHKRNSSGAVSIDNNASAGQQFVHSNSSSALQDPNNPVSLLLQGALGPLYTELLELFTTPIPGFESSDSVDEVLPGGVYWHLLTIAIEQSRIRPQNVRLCLLPHVVEPWSPRMRVLEAARRVLAPLQPLTDKRLLTKEEAAMYSQWSGFLLQKVIDILERHYEYYEASPSHGIACLSAAQGILQLVVTATSAPEVTTRMMRIHLGSAVERRMRALLHPTTNSLAHALEVLSANHPGEAVLPSPINFSSAEADLRHKSGPVAAWLGALMTSASQGNDRATVFDQSSVMHKRSQSVADVLKASGKGADGAGGTAGIVDISHLVVAVLVMIDDTRHDLLLQPVFKQHLDLPMFTTHIRYRMLLEQLLTTFDAQSSVTYSEAVYQLQEKVFELHSVLEQAGLGYPGPADSVPARSSAAYAGPGTSNSASATAGNGHTKRASHGGDMGFGARGGVAASEGGAPPTKPQSRHNRSASAMPLRTSELNEAVSSPSFNVSGTLPDRPVELVNVCALFDPAVEIFIRNLGKKLLEWVDLTISAETSRAEGTRWAPVSSQSQYSFSVVDLYFHLQTVLESVCKRVMRYGSRLQNARTARLLHNVIARAVQRYISHVEQLSLQQVQNGEGRPAPDSPRGFKAPSPAFSASPLNPSSASVANGAALRPPSMLGVKSPASAIGVAPHANSRLGSTSYLGSVVGGGNGAIAGSVSAAGAAPADPAMHAAVTAAAALAQGLETWLNRAAVTPEVCVLLNNLEQVVQQQRQLEKMLVQAGRNGGSFEAVSDLSPKVCRRRRKHRASSTGKVNTLRMQTDSSPLNATSISSLAASSAHGTAGAGPTAAQLRAPGIPPLGPSTSQRHSNSRAAAAAAPVSSAGSATNGGADWQQQRNSRPSPTTGQNPDLNSNDIGSEFRKSASAHSRGVLEGKKDSQVSRHTRGDIDMEVSSEDDYSADDASLMSSDVSDMSGEEDGGEGVEPARASSQRWQGTNGHGSNDGSMAAAAASGTSAVFGDQSERLSRVVHHSLHGIMQHVGAQLQRKVIAAFITVLTNLAAKAHGHVKDASATNHTPSSGTTSMSGSMPGVASGGLLSFVHQGHHRSGSGSGGVGAAAAATASAAALSGSTSRPGSGGGSHPRFVDADIEPELQLLSESMYSDLAVMKQHLSPMLFRKVLSCCWDYTLGGVRRMTLGQAAFRPLRPQELAILRTGLEQLMDDFHAGGEGLPLKLLQHRADPKLQLLQLAAQDTASLVAFYNTLTDDIILNPRMAASVRSRDGRVSHSALPSDKDGSSRHPSTDVVPLDIIRLLLQRVGDKAATDFWAQQGPTARECVMQMVFGLPAEEAVLVFAPCRLVSCAQPGIVYLTTSYVAFTTLFQDGDASTGGARAPGGAMSKLKASLFSHAGGPGEYVPDTTLLMSLKDVERLDCTFHMSAPALTLTMMSRTAHVLTGFEDGVRDKLVQAIRLHVMGAGTSLDRCLRGLEGTQGALALALPAGEAIVRSYPCNRYAVMASQPGVLYLCSSRLVFDSESGRLTVLYNDLTSLKRTKDWRGGAWVVLQYSASTTVAADGTVTATGAAGVTGGAVAVGSAKAAAVPQLLQVGNGTEELAGELLQAIASLSG